MSADDAMQAKTVSGAEAAQADADPGAAFLGSGDVAAIKDTPDHQAGAGCQHPA